MGIEKTTRLTAVLEAASELGLSAAENPFSDTDNRQYLYDEYGNIKAVIDPTGNINGLNSVKSEKRSADKSLAYECLKNAHIQCPQSQIFRGGEEFNALATNLNLVILFAEKNGYPLIIKPNQASLSKGVRLVQNQNELIDGIFQLLKGHQDVIIQQYIPGPEFKIVLYRDEILFAYEKTSNGPIRPYSPGHAREIHKISPEIGRLLIEIALALGLNYCSVDLRTSSLSVVDLSKTYVLELNSHPGIKCLLDKKGPAFVQKLYKTLLMDVISSFKIPSLY